MTTTVAGRVTRYAAMDRVRGLAIVLMILDHVLALTHTGSPVRLTVTRVCVPLFFILSGHLVRRFSWRTAGIGIVGFFLPLLVPWIDQPNVLFIYAVGAFILSNPYVAKIPPSVVVAISLTFAANGFDTNHFGYGVGSLIGLMALGKMLQRNWFAWGEKLPTILTTVGKYPLSIYVGHLLILTAVFR